mgnify:CR=1 FL=1
MSGHHHHDDHDHAHHGHDHGAQGHAGHSHAPANFGRAFAIGIALNAAFVLIEAGYGFVSNSTALLADAGHNLSDVLGLLVAWIAMQIVELFSKTRELTPAGLTLLINRENPLLIDLSAYADFEKMHVPGAKHVAMRDRKSVG